MGSLHEGVFLNQTQAEAYISIFAPQTSAADTENIKRTSGLNISSLYTNYCCHPLEVRSSKRWLKGK